jgi:hypothetical protein
VVNVIGRPKAHSLFVLGGLVVAVAAALAVTAPASGAIGTTTCEDDFLAPGSYGAVVVPAGSFCFGEGGVMIGRGLTIEAGATFSLSSEDSPGPLNSIYGGVIATNPANVQIHFTTINGGLNIQGGSGPFGGPFGITWNAIEDNTINGAVTIDAYDGFWMGFIRKHGARLGEPQRQRAAGSRRERIRDEHDPREPELLRRRSGPTDRGLGRRAEHRDRAEDRSVRGGLNEVDRPLPRHALQSAGSQEVESDP